MSPMTTWEDIAGRNCAKCGKPASHFYAGEALCCQCHGGDVISVEETAEMHKKCLESKERGRDDGV